MKYLIFKYLVFTLFFILSCDVLYSQKKFSEGYVITTSRDTLHGKVRDEFLVSSAKIEFISAEGEKMTFAARDIYGYSKAGVVDYMTIKSDLLKEFARVVVDGDIRLLLIHKKGASSGINSSDDNSSFDAEEVAYFYLYNTQYEDLMHISAFDFKNVAADYFSADDKLEAMILNKELRYNDLEIIVETYNKGVRQAK